MVLAAIASRTKRIRLGSAVTVLSSDDPIRVFQRYATLETLLEESNKSIPTLTSVVKAGKVSG